MARRLLIFCSIICLFFSSCKKREQVTRAFYFWKSSWQLSAYEQQTLDSLHSAKIYLKIFDVTWNSRSNSATPTAKIIVKDSLPSGYTYIPVIYITNEALLKTAKEKIPELAVKIHILTAMISKGIHLHYTEIQFDCDWSDRTKDNYFLLLNELRKWQRAPIQFSATIRLHQVKYYKRTGIPPVDRGMLMFYNMGKVGDLRTVNSIYNKTDAEKYTSSIRNYPLACDAALPIFKWGVLFQRGKIAGLFNALSAEELIATDFIKRENGYYSPPKAMYFRGYYLETTDLIRIEEVTPELALEAAQLLENEMPQRDLTVALYHLEPDYLKTYGKENIEKIYHSFE